MNRDGAGKDAAETYDKDEQLDEIMFWMAKKA